MSRTMEDSSKRSANSRNCAVQSDGTEKIQHSQSRSHSCVVDWHSFCILCSSVVQSVTILESFLALTDDLRDELYMLALFLCVELQQESILLKMDGQPMLVSERKENRTEKNALIRTWKEEIHA